VRSWLRTTRPPLRLATQSYRLSCASWLTATRAEELAKRSHTIAWRTVHRMRQRLGLA
jgi:hypothetical protein